MTSGTRPDQASTEAPASADPGQEAVELAARISRRLSATDSKPRQRMPTPRPPATA